MLEVWYLLKEILFGAGGVSLVSLGILSVHWNVREVVAYKTGLGKKVRVVKTGSEQEEVKYRSNTLRPLGKVKFAEAALEEGKVEETSKKLEVAKEESYIYTQAVVGDLGDAIDDMLEKQKGSLGQGIVPEVEEDVLEDIDVEAYEGTQVLTVDDGHTTVLVEEEVDEVDSKPVEYTQVLVEQEEVQTSLEHTQVLVENQEEVKEDKIDNENYFTEVLEQEPEVLENEVNYGTDILVSEHEGDISDEESKYLTEVLVEDEEIDVTEDVVVGDDLTDNDFEYITQVMVDTEESNEDYTTTVLVDDAVEEEVVEDAAYETQVLVDEVDYHTTVLVEEEPDYNTTVLVEDEPDYNTTVLVADEDYNTTVLGNEEDDYHTVAFEDDGTTGNVVGESVESAKTVGVEDIKVIYTNYELEEE